MARLPNTPNQELPIGRGSSLPYYPHHDSYTIDADGNVRIVCACNTRAGVSHSPQERVSDMFLEMHRAASGIQKEPAGEGMTQTFSFYSLAPNMVAWIKRLAP